MKTEIFAIVNENEKNERKYYILTDEVSVLGGHISCEYYGIMIEDCEQIESLRYLTPSISAISELARKVSSCAVAPSGLKLAADEFLGKEIA